MKNEGTKNVLLGVLIVGLVSMTVAFAALSTQLNISGTAKVTAQTWKVVLADWQLDTENSSKNIVYSQEAATGNTDVVVTDNNSCTECTDITGLNFDFKKPGTKVQYNFKIQNKGTIDAKNVALTFGEKTCTDKSGNQLYSYDRTGIKVDYCPITFEVKCGGSPLVSGTPMSTVLTGDNASTNSIACTYMVQYNDDYTSDSQLYYHGGNVTGQEINVSGLDVHWTWQQN